MDDLEPDHRKDPHRRLLRHTYQEGPGFLLLATRGGRPPGRVGHRDAANLRLRARAVRLALMASGSTTSATRASWRGSIAPASSRRCGFRARPRSGCATSSGVARRSSARFSSRATTSSSSSPGAASSFARAHWCTPHLRGCTPPTPRVALAGRSDARVSRVSCAARVQAAAARRAGSPDRAARLTADARADGRSAAVLPRDRCRARWCWRRRSSIGVASSARRNWLAYLGLVSREDSSGDRERKGSITKAGNSHCRHVLIQAAWSYHHRPQTSVDLKATAGGTAAGRDHARVEGATAAASAVHASQPIASSRRSPWWPWRVNSSASSGR